MEKEGLDASMEEFVFFETSDLREEEIFLKLLRTTQDDPVRKLVPSYHFEIRSTKTGEKMGFCDLRIGSHYNVPYTGNIGYQVFERFRGRHYAARACRLMFRQALKHGMEQLIITCGEENLASRRTCELVGAFHEGVIEVPRNHSVYTPKHRRLNRFIWRVKR